MSNKPHSRQKRVVDKTVRVEKKSIDNKKSNSALDLLKSIFGTKNRK